MNSLVRAGLMLLAMLVGAASGQVGSVGPAESDRPSHAWLTLPGEDGLVMAHVPPRELMGPGESSAGLLRMVRPLRETPEAMAGLGDRVYVVFGATETAGDGGRTAVRRVLTGRSLPAGVSGLWTDVPSGMFDPAPGLPGAGRLVDLAVSSVSAGRVYALMRGVGGGGALSLLRLENDAWVSVELPFAGTVDPAEAALVSFGRGVLLAMREGGTSLGWTLGPDGVWHIARLADWDRFWAAQWRHGLGRAVVVGVAEGAGTGVWTIGEQNAWRLGRADVGPEGAPVVLASTRRLLVAERRDGVVHGAEMSLVTGRMLHDGTVRNRPAVSVGEFRLIVAMLVAVMVAALLVIVRPTPQAAWTVPDGFVLGEPGRRVIATMLDIVLMVWVVAPAFGVSVREVLTLQVLMAEGHAWMVIPAVMLGGSLAMGVWEGLLGFSPGKLAVGLRVYRAQGGPIRKLGVFWGLVRSTMKWMVPPVAALGLLDRQGRHRGDAAARAVVVTRAGDPS